MCVNGSFLAGLVSSQTPTVTVANSQVSNSQLSYSLIYLFIKVHRRNFQFFFQEIPVLQILEISVRNKVKICHAKDFCSAGFLSSIRLSDTSGNNTVSNSQLLYSLIYLLIKVHRRSFQLFQEIPLLQSLEISVRNKVKICRAKDFCSAAFLWSKRPRVT